MTDYTKPTELRMIYTKSQEQTVRFTRRAADHGDRDGQYNLAHFHEDGIGVKRDMEQAIFWYRKAALQNHDLAIQKCKELGVDLDAPTLDREAIRKALECRIYPLGYLERYKYTVICSSFNGKWILSKHKKRNTWETQGGHIEDGETPLECARRELFEESGIKDADLYPVCDYWGFNSQACSNGMVFLAVVHSLGELPESEMKEIKIFDALPAELTYPNVSPRLYAEAEKLLKDLNEIYLTPMTNELYHQYCQNYENDPDLYMNMDAFKPYSYDFEAAEAYMLRKREKKQIVFAVMRNGLPIGEVLLKEIDHENKACALGICMQNGSVKGKGYGTKAEQLILDYAIDELGMKTVYADAILKNTRSQHVLSKVGFVKIGEDDKFKYYKYER